MSKLKQTFATVTIVSVLIWGALPGGVSALTAAELQVQIDALMAQLNTLQAQLPSGTSTPSVSSGAPAACSGVTLSRNLTVGSSGTDVKCLQALLNQSADTQVSASGVGSAGNETTFFGNLTRAAVKKYQEKYSSAVLAPVGLSAGTGFFGPSTRTQANSMLSVAVAPAPAPAPAPSPTPGTPAPAPTPTPTTGPVSVALASDNPAAKTLAASSAYNTVLNVQVNGGSAGASVTSVTVERFGLSVDTNVSGVLIVDANGNRHGNVVTLATNVATIPFSSDPIVVPANGSTTFRVQVHIAAAGTAGTIGFKVTEVSGTPSGLPLVGNLNTLSASAGILGAVTVGTVSQTTASVSVDIGQTDYVLTKFRVSESSGNEDIKISRITVFQNGTAADADLINWDLVDINGNVLATVVQATNKVVAFNLATPYTIAKGTNRDLTVRLDVAAGSQRTGQTIIQNDYDMQVVGSSTGLGILPTAVAIGGSGDTSFPVGDIANGTAGYNLLTVNQGTMTVNKSGSSPSGIFGIGQTNVTLGIWELNAQGEDIQIQRADIAIGGTTEAADFAGTVKLMTDAGQTLYSVAASTAALYDSTDVDLANPDDDGADIATFSTYYTIPAGTTLKVKLVADASSSIGAETAVGNISDVYFKRMTSNTFGTASAAAFVSGNTLTASSVTLTVVNNASVGATTVIEGGSNTLLGSYLLQTSSAEGVNISSIATRVAIAGVSTTDITPLSNLKLKRADTGAQLGTIVSAPAAIAGGFSTNTFSVSGQLNIPASTTVQIDLYGNLSTAASNGGTDDTYITSIAADVVSGVGAISGTSVTGPGAAVTGRTLTVVEGGTLTVSVDTSGAASSAFLTSGATGAELGRVKFAATVEDMKVTRLVLRTVNGAGNIANVKLLGTGLSSDPSVPLTAGTATFTFASGSEIIVPSYGSRVVTAVVDLTGVGTTIASRLGVLGFGAADVTGAGSGLTVQERLTGTVEVAGTNVFAGVVGDVVYFTVTATDGTAGGTASNTAPGFYMVTAIGSTTLTTATGSLTLNGDGDDVAWATGDVVTTLTKVNTDAGTIDAMAMALVVGDLVYVHDAGTVANDGFYTIATAVAAGATAVGATTLSGDAVSTPGTALTLVAGDSITKFTNANGLGGNTMRFEEVEPVITVGSTPASGSATPSTTQTVATFNVKASGARDITFDTLAIEKTGATSAWTVKDFKLYNGTTLLAEVSGLAANTRAAVDAEASTATINVADNGTIGLAPSDTVLYIERDTEANSRAGTVSTITDSDTLVTTADIVPGTAETEDFLIKYSVSDNMASVAATPAITVADGSKYQVGDQIYVINATTAANGGGATVASVGATSVTLTLAALTDLVDNAAVITNADNVTIYNITRGSNTVVFGASSPTTALASQTITAGQTLTLTVEADTTHVKRAVVSSAISSAAASFGVKIPGTAGPLQVTTSQVEGFNWDYTPLNTTGTALPRTEGDSYPVNGPTLNY